MKHATLWARTAVIGLTASALLPAIACADSGATRAEMQTQAAIEKVLRDTEAALARGDTATQVVHGLYADNVLITEEPPVVNLRGTAAAIEGVQAFLDALGPGGGKGCRYTVIEPVVASKTTFSSYLALNCAANPPVLPENMDLRMLYVWKRLPQGWRVVLEAVQTGKF